MTKLIVAYGKFSKAPKNKIQSFEYLRQTRLNAQKKKNKLGRNDRPEQTYVSNQYVYTSLKTADAFTDLTKLEVYCS